MDLTTFYGRRTDLRDLVFFTSFVFDGIVSFMERYGDLCKPKDGARGKAHAAVLWEQLVQELNSSGLGDTKSLEKWKKVWSDYKNNVKKKAARINREANKTGGGPAYDDKLSSIEWRVLVIIGVKSATGLDVPEIGLEEELSAGAEVSLPKTPLLQTIPVQSVLSVPSNGNEDWDLIELEASTSTAEGAQQLTTDQSASLQVPSQQATGNPVSPQLTSPEPSTPLHVKRPDLSPPGQQRKKLRPISRANGACALFLRSDEAFRAHETKRLELEERRLNLEERRLHLEEGWQRLADKFLTNQAEQLQLLNNVIERNLP